MDTKHKLAKSKSSNSTVNKCTKNRKSPSSAKFPGKYPKKRGVYVEKLLSEDKKPETYNNQGKQRCVFTVNTSENNLALAILSNKTVGTQYYKAKSESNNIDIHSKRKAKYMLNNLSNTDKSVIVLKKTNNIAKSSTDLFRISTMSTLASSKNYLKQILNREMETEDTHLNVNSSLVREVLEGREPKKTKRVRIDESSTLVCNENPTNFDKNCLYKLFVNILEDTLDDSKSTSNVEASRIDNSKKSTSNHFEIDETVADKLNIIFNNTNDVKNVDVEEKSCTEEHCYNIKNDNIRTKIPADFTKYKTRYSKLKTKPQKTQLVITKKSAQKTVKQNKDMLATKKKNLNKNSVIAMLRKQLSQDDPEEPKNLYEALKVISDNKKRSLNTANIEEKVRKKHESSPECVLKRPNVMRRQKLKRKRERTPVDSDDTEVTANNNFKQAHSKHSLEIIDCSLIEAAVQNNNDNIFL
ncbi:hypothetical protein ACJJTC_001690 [Scirpophaga incertulas]